MQKCEKCRHHITDDQRVWHDYCADEYGADRFSAGNDYGREEGRIEGHEEARGEFAENARNRDVIELAEAIRIGDWKRAETALDLVAAEIQGWSELIAKGRYSLAANRTAA